MRFSVVSPKEKNLFTGLLNVLFALRSAAMGKVVTGEACYCRELFHFVSGFIDQAKAYLHAVTGLSGWYFGWFMENSVMSSQDPTICLFQSVM